MVCLPAALETTALPIELRPYEVHKEGVEPSTPKGLESESSAYPSFATRADEDRVEFSGNPGPNRAYPPAGRPSSF